MWSRDISAAIFLVSEFALLRHMKLGRVGLRALGTGLVDKPENHSQYVSSLPQTIKLRHGTQRGAELGTRGREHEDFMHPLEDWRPKHFGWSGFISAWTACTSGNTEIFARLVDFQVDTARGFNPSLNVLMNVAGVSTSTSWA